MRHLDASTIESLVSLPELIDAMATAYRDVAAGRDRSPLRSHLALPGGDLLVMPGLRDGASGVSLKVVSVVDANRHRGLATVQALVVWIDAETGTPVASLDGTAVTLLRTAAGSAAATRVLARDDARVLAMIGAGAQAEWQVRAICAVRPIAEVRIWSPSERRVELARRLDAELTGRVVAAASAEDAVRDADVVTCATTSSEPVMDAEWLRAGVHVNGIGAYRPGMVEIPAEAFARAEVVAVDSRAAALAEAGDLMAAVAGGAIGEETIVEIGALGAAPRDPRAITVFKSVGLAVQDSAAAELVVARARVAGVLD